MSIHLCALHFLSFFPVRSPSYIRTFNPCVYLVFFSSVLPLQYKFFHGREYGQIEKYKDDHADDIGANEYQIINDNIS